MPGCGAGADGGAGVGAVGADFTRGWCEMGFLPTRMDKRRMSRQRDDVALSVSCVTVCVRGAVPLIRQGHRVLRQRDFIGFITGAKPAPTCVRQHFCTWRVQRCDHRCGHEHTPISVHGEERQRPEHMEVRFEPAPGQMDEQRPHQHLPGR